MKTHEAFNRWLCDCHTLSVRSLIYAWALVFSCYSNLAFSALIETFNHQGVTFHAYDTVPPGCNASSYSNGGLWTLPYGKGYVYRDLSTCGDWPNSAYVFKSNTPDNSNTPEQQCVDSGKYWYNDQCNDLAEADQESACYDANNYWHNGACYPTHPICYPLSGTAKIFSTNYSINQTKPDNPPDNICEEKPAITNDTYNGCHYNRDGSAVYNDVGGWSAQYRASGDPCFSINNQIVVLESSTDICESHEMIFTSLTELSDLPTTISDKGALCDLVFDSVVGTNQLNQCHKYKYKGVAGSGGFEGSSIGDITPCDFNERLSCQSPQYPSEDGLTCVSPTYPTGLGFQLNINSYTGNPHAIYVVETGFIDSFAIDSKYLTLNSASNRHYPSVPIDKRFYMPELITLVSDWVKDVGQGIDTTFYSTYTEISDAHHVKNHFTRDDTFIKTMSIDGIVIDHASSSITASVAYKINTVSKVFQLASGGGGLYDPVEKMATCRSRGFLECVMRSDNWGAFGYKITTTETSSSFPIATLKIKSDGYHYGEGGPDTRGTAGAVKVDFEGSDLSLNVDPGNGGEWSGTTKDQSVPTFKQSTERFWRIVKESKFIKAIDLTGVKFNAKPQCSNINFSMPWFDDSLQLNDTIDVEIPICVLFEDPEIKPVTDIVVLLYWLSLCVIIIVRVLLR